MNKILIGNLARIINLFNGILYLLIFVGFIFHFTLQTYLFLLVVSFLFFIIGGLLQIKTSYVFFQWGHVAHYRVGTTYPRFVTDIRKHGVISLWLGLTGSILAIVYYLFPNFIYSNVKHILPGSLIYLCVSLMVINLTFNRKK